LARHSGVEHQRADDDGHDDRIAEIATGREVGDPPGRGGDDDRDDRLDNLVLDRRLLVIYMSTASARERQQNPV